MILLMHSSVSLRHVNFDVVFSVFKDPLYSEQDIWYTLLASSCLHYASFSVGLWEGSEVPQSVKVWLSWLESPLDESV